MGRKSNKNPIEKGETWIDEATNLVQCPYQPSHRILPERFALHLTRCRKATLADSTSPFHEAALKVMICQFDNTHHIRGGQEKMNEHLKECPTANALKKPSKAPAVIPEWKKTKARETVPLVDLDEDWDSEGTAGVYNPVNKLLATPNVILNPQGLTKSQRRTFRANQRGYANGSGDQEDGETFDSMWVPPIAENK